MLLVGPPGTAKSRAGPHVRPAHRRALLRVPADALHRAERALRPGRHPRLPRGHLHAQTETMLPEAEIVFLDEIFKSNSAILNSLLTILNERKFSNGSKVMDVPLLSMFGASNEVPNDDTLAAIFDRFLLRVVSRQPRQLPLPQPHREGHRQRGGAADRQGRRRQRALRARATCTSCTSASIAHLALHRGLPRRSTRGSSSRSAPRASRSPIAASSSCSSCSPPAPSSTGATRPTTATSSSSSTSGTTSTRPRSSRRSSARSSIAGTATIRTSAASPRARSASTICSPSCRSSASC